MIVINVINSLEDALACACTCADRDYSLRAQQSCSASGGIFPEFSKDIRRYSIFVRMYYMMRFYKRFCFVGPSILRSPALSTRLLSACASLDAHMHTHDMHTYETAVVSAVPTRAPSRFVLVFCFELILLFD
jgi:hypothetical protein